MPGISAVSPPSSAQPLSRQAAAMPPTIDSATAGDKPAGREIVEEEQRLGALDQDVVDAVIDEIDADGVVPVGQERDLQLGADAVGARDEHRMLVSSASRAETARRRTRCPTARPA